jgi:hypothetical protein
MKKFFASKKGIYNVRNISIYDNTNVACNNFRQEVAIKKTPFHHRFGVLSGTQSFILNLCGTE